MSAKSVQAPIGGLNRYDSIDDQPEYDAWVLDNWIPDSGYCRLRKGYAETEVDLGLDPIETIIEFGDTLIVATGDSLIETGLSRSGLTNPPFDKKTLGTGFRSAKWQWEVFNEKLLLVNGQDTPQQYDGTTLTPINFTSGINNPEELIGVSSFKGRAFYWKDEPGYYYAEAGSYQGEMAYFDLSPWVSKKAKLTIFFTWSADAGDGTDDFACFLHDTGECLVYQGTDPSDLDYYAQIGRYQMGRPLSIRAGASIAGDYLVLTRDGWQNFRVIWETGNFRDQGLGKKIVGIATEAARRFGDLEGWEAHFFPEDGLVMVSLPNKTQHVMNTNTMAWSTFSGWDAVTFGAFSGRIYFGTEDGKLILAMEGFADGDNPIVSDALPAFNYLSGRANQKQMTGVRAITTIQDPDTIEFTGTSDYLVVDPRDPVLSERTRDASPWGSPWGSPWSNAPREDAYSQWETVNAHGFALSYRMNTKTKGQEVLWTSSAIMFKDAGII